MNNLPKQTQTSAQINNVVKKSPIINNKNTQVKQQ